MQTRLAEIDALKRNLSSVLANINASKVGAADDPTGGEFFANLDAIIEAENLRVHQIALIGHLIETAFAAGRDSRE